MLCLLLTLIPLRAVINESITFEVARMFRHVAAVGTANPGTTFLFTWVIALAAAAAWIRRLALGAPRYRRTGGEIGLALLVIAGGIACTIAGQKHLALIGAFNFVTLILYAFTLRQFLTSPWRVRLALIVIAATAIVVVAKCGWQYFVETPDTIAYWEKHKAELLGPDANATTGKAVGMQHDYEMRMLSRLVTGFYPHANVLGSHLILFIMAAAGLIGDRLARIRTKQTSPLTLILPTLIIGGCFVALRGTDSKGALACACLGIAIWIVAGAMRRIIARHRTLTAAAIWLVGIAGVITLILFLKSNEAGLGKSIQFRSMYWRGAIALIEDGHSFGVGPLNFGRHFLRYKPVECPEEVESPHSWPVRLAAEWGIPGLIAFVVVLVGFTWRLTRSPTSIASTQDRGPPDSIVWWPIALTGTTYVSWLMQLSNTNGLVFIELLAASAVIWLMGMMLLSLESPDDSTFSDAPLLGVLPAVIAGMLCFLLHTGIDLAMFEGGPATTFFAMIAIALACADMSEVDESSIPAAATESRPATPHRRAAVAVGVVTAVVGMFAFVKFVVGPYTCQGELQNGRTDIKPSTWETYLTTGGGAWYLDAVDAYTLDGTAPSELAEQLIPRVQSVRNADYAIGLVDEFARRDPYDGLHHNTRGTIASQKYQMTKDVRFLRQAADEYELYVDDYPTSPLRHIYAATILTQLARDHHDDDARNAAIKHLETALALDEQRIYVSKPNRLPPEQIEQIRQGIEALRKLPN